MGFDAINVSFNAIDTKSFGEHVRKNLIIWSHFMDKDLKNKEDKSMALYEVAVVTRAMKDNPENLICGPFVFCAKDRDTVILEVGRKIESGNLSLPTEGVDILVRQFRE